MLITGQREQEIGRRAGGEEQETGAEAEWKLVNLF